MCALQTGSSPVRDYRAFVARAAVAALMAAMGGCATNSSQSTAGYPPSGVKMAQAAVDVESDGLPAQTPPPAGIRHLPDDPQSPSVRTTAASIHRQPRRRSLMKIRRSSMRQIPRFQTIYRPSSARSSLPHWRRRTRQILERWVRCFMSGAGCGSSLFRCVDGSRSL